MAETGGTSPRFAALTAQLDRARPLVIQTHDFPDIDAMASAWGLASLLCLRGYRAACAYRGRIRSRSLARLVSELGVSASMTPPTGKDGGRLQIIVVDGSPTNGNVTLFEGDLVAVLDHHCTQGEPRAGYLDIRPDLAACSTIVEGYWEEAGESIPHDVATALVAGIQSDTDFLSRRVSAPDFAAYSALFSAGDFEKASRIVRTVFDLADLDLAVKALSASVTREGILWAWLPGPCSQEVLAVLAEFVLRTEDLKAAVVAERGEKLSVAAPGEDGVEKAPETGVHISVRSKDPALSAFGLVRKALDGIGQGGGHAHSAGGFVPDTSFPGEAALRELFFAVARDAVAREYPS
jgi:nanoRNase/pAp phosphatase (c-di-AMP/oligoRNAs hydrolase)